MNMNIGSISHGTKEKWMKQTFITRKDAGIGVGEFDSIAWSFSQHVKEPDTGEFNSAVMFGNEDSPVRIEFYAQENPKVTDVPAWVWVSPEHRAEGHDV